MRKKFTVIGLGSFGSWIAKTIFDYNHEVTAIDHNKEKIQGIKKCVSLGIVGESTNKDFLVSLGLKEMDAVIVSLGENVSASLLVTLYLHEIGVKRILVKAVDDDHGKILKKIGATDVIFPERESAVKVAKNLILPNILEYLPITEEYEIAELAPPQSFIGKSLALLHLPRKFRITVIAVKEFVPENFVFLPKADFVIKDSDSLLVLGKREDIEKIKSG